MRHIIFVGITGFAAMATCAQAAQNLLGSKADQGGSTGIFLYGSWDPEYIQGGGRRAVEVIIGEDPAAIRYNTVRFAPDAVNFQKSGTFAVPGTLFTRAINLSLHIDPFVVELAAPHVSALVHYTGTRFQAASPLGSSDFKPVTITGTYTLTSANGSKTGAFSHDAVFGGLDRVLNDLDVADLPRVASFANSSIYPSFPNQTLFSDTFEGVPLSITAGMYEIGLGAVSLPLNRTDMVVPEPAGLLMYLGLPLLLRRRRAATA